MRNNYKKAVLLFFAVAIGLMSIRLFITTYPQQGEKVDTAEGISYIASHETVKATQSTTKKKELISSKQNKKNNKKKKNAKKKTESPTIKDGNFRAAYKDFIISGDSLVKAIEEYGYLDNKTVRAEIGVGTSYLSKTTKDIVAAKPKYLILHYGENELDKKENAVNFINRYKKCIRTLQKQLPDTKIYVDSIFPVQKKAHKSEPYTVNIGYYNGLLKKMAAELKVGYIDFTPLWKSFDKNYFDADGIHPLGTFYTEQYLPYVYTEVMSKN